MRFSIALKVTSYANKTKGFHKGEEYIIEIGDNHEEHIVKLEEMKNDKKSEQSYLKGGNSYIMEIYPNSMKQENVTHAEEKNTKGETMKKVKTKIETTTTTLKTTETITTTKTMSTTMTSKRRIAPKTTIFTPFNEPGNDYRLHPKASIKERGKKKKITVKKVNEKQKRTTGSTGRNLAPRVPTIRKGTTKAQTKSKSSLTKTQKPAMVKGKY